MTKKTLGIDIGDSHITGVVLEQHGKISRVAACLSLPFIESSSLPEQIRLVCEQLSWNVHEGDCVCGLPLSVLSVRNLTLPFRDMKKVAQALPFELEEQLLVPADTLVTDFFPSEVTESGCHILTFSVEQKLLGQLLDGVQGLADPEFVTPAALPLAAQVADRHRNVEKLLLLHADIHSVTMILILGGRPVFCRQLSYPEQMILQPPFVMDGERLVTTDGEMLKQCMRQCCISIERNLDYVQWERKVETRPDLVALTGPLSGGEGVEETIAASLQAPVEKLDLLSAFVKGGPGETYLSGQSQFFDPALALALSGSKGPAINFRKDGFVKKRSVFSAQKRLVQLAAVITVLLLCWIGYMWNDYRLLRNRDALLRSEMVTIFKQTFPGTTKVREPYLEMKAALKSVQGPTSSPQMWGSGKRVLDLLADLSARIPASVSLQVNRLSIEQETLLVKGTTDTFNAVELIKNSLAASPRYKGVQIISATADKEKKSGAIRFELKLQLSGDV